jgi:hypothetical protein
MSLILGNLELQQPNYGGLDYGWKFWVEQGRDEVPAVRGGWDLIPMRAGSLAVRGLGDTRILEVKGYIKAASTALFRSYLDILKPLFDPTVAVPLILWDTLPDGTVRWLRAKTANVVWDPSVLESELIRIASIEVHSPDYVWYSRWGSLTLDAGYALDAWQGYVLDSSGEWIVTPAGDPFVSTLSVFGTVASERVRVQLEGPSSGPPSILWTPPGLPAVGFTMANALVANDVLVVDNFARTAILNGATNIRSQMTLAAGNRGGEYLRLGSGDIPIRIGGTPAKVRLLFNPAYL